jgi:putative phosphoesterase
MRIAIVSDIHGTQVAFEAVLADLRETAPDLVLHGGDLGHGGSNPAAIVDRIRDLGWRGVAGNADEMLWRPEALTEFAAVSPGVRPLLSRIGDMAEAAREALGEERIGWLRALPRRQTEGPTTLVHASFESFWSAPGAEAADAELEAVYRPLQSPVVVYGHIHKPFVRRISGMTIANSGSVSLSYDGDRRAAYLLLDEARPAIRRVEYDVDHEIAAMRAAAVPHADWVGRMLERGCFVMPETVPG